MSNLARTALAIDADLLGQFDAWMAGHGYENRSQAVRDLIRKALVEQEWSDPNAEVVAALSIVFDHKQAVTKGLTDMQHEDHHAILCSQHVHITHERCLEVILMRGKAAQLRRIADAIITTRGVKTGQLTMLSENV